MFLKNTLSILVILFCISSTYSQKLGLEAGYNLSNMTSYEMSNSLSGFNVGVIVDFMEERDIYHVNTGLKFSQKGVKTEDLFYLSGDRYKYRLNYIELPVNFAFHIFIKESKVGILAQYGIYTACDFDNDFAFDLGANFGVGVVGHVLKFSLNYQLGFIQVINDKKNRVFSANLAVVFW